MAAETVSPTVITLVLSTVSLLSGYALTRSGKAQDRLDNHGESLTELRARLKNLETTHDRMHTTTDQARSTMTEVLLQVEAIRAILGSAGVGGVAHVVADIQAIIGRMQQTQTLDHAVITALRDRVDTLERFLRPTNGPPPA